MTEARQARVKLTRRGFVATIAALFVAPKPAPALGGAVTLPPGYDVVISVGLSCATHSEFSRRYFQPAAEAIARNMDYECARGWGFMKPQPMQVRFDPARLPA